MVVLPTIPGTEREGGSGRAAFFRRSRLFWIAFVLIWAPLVGTPAQEVYSDLKDPAQLKTFTRASDALVCQCGCHLVLSTCPHVECPFAIPIRRFMEARIKEGMTAEQIVQGMQTGFGRSYINDPLVKTLAAQGRNDLVKGLINGFGDKVSAHTSSLVPTIIIAVFSVLAIFLTAYWLGRRKRIIAAVAETNSEPGNQGKKEDGLGNIMEKLDEFDQ